ncbi:MAG: four-carbon acid sugar kinase family protein [Rhizobiaceae bacterium]|nr:four-carbon acid sugar kinase family protein [Rhizobiaceae bacterium]
MIDPAKHGSAAPYLAWYGDDFTGAAATMEVLEFAGFPSVLFLDAPTAELLARFPGRFGVGIAGDARTRSPEWMDQNLPPIFAALKATGARILHYKACSTMDSAPHIGSIGRAAELGLAAMGEEALGFAPLILAAPALGRWQAFGNLFARAPAGIARLDRHPTMSRHPVTPMNESDVRLHIAEQTALQIGLVDVVALQAGKGQAALDAAVNSGARIIAIDVMDDRSLAAAGELMWNAAGDKPLFVLGSQGVEYGLAAARPQHADVQSAPAAGQIMVISGSASPDTARQIAAAEMNGFVVISIDAAAALDERAWAAASDTAQRGALDALASGLSPIICTARGPDDPALQATAEARTIAGLSAHGANETLARNMGQLLKAIRDLSAVSRCVIAGGDTSSHASRALGIEALTAKARIAPGAPLLDAHTLGSNPCELVLKGGQMGTEDFFIRARDGASHT